MRKSTIRTTLTILKHHNTKPHNTKQQNNTKHHIAKQQYNDTRLKTHTIRNNNTLLFSRKKAHNTKTHNTNNAQY